MECVCFCVLNGAFITQPNIPKQLQKPKNGRIGEWDPRGLIYKPRDLLNNHRPFKENIPFGKLLKGSRFCRGKLAASVQTADVKHTRLLPSHKDVQGEVKDFRDVYICWPRKRGRGVKANRENVTPRQTGENKPLGRSGTPNGNSSAIVTKTRKPTPVAGARFQLHWIGWVGEHDPPGHPQQPCIVMTDLVRQYLLTGRVILLKEFKGTQSDRRLLLLRMSSRKESFR